MIDRFNYFVLFTLINLFLSIYVIVSYLNYQQESTLKSWTVDDASQKYIQFLCEKQCGGLGDRFKGLLSAYAWSLLANRSFVIDVKTPCPFENLYDTNEIDWRVRPASKSVTTRSIGYGWIHYTKLGQEDLLDYTNKSGRVLRVLSGLMFMNALSTNNYLQSRIKEIGYEPKKFKLQYLMHEFYEKLFRLKPDQQAEYDDIVERVLKKKSHKLICAQLRVGASTRTGAEDLKFSTTKATDLSQRYWRFIQNELIIKQNISSFMLYVTTDSETVKKEAIKWFGEDRVFFFKESNYHFEIDFLPSIFRWPSTEKYRCSKNRRTILDFHMMRECDMGVVSHSGYGLMGLWNRPVPNKDLWVYSSLNYIRTGKFDNHNQSFIKLDDMDEFFFSM